MDLSEKGNCSYTNLKAGQPIVFTYRQFDSQQKTEVDPKICSLCVSQVREKANNQNFPYLYQVSVPYPIIVAWVSASGCLETNSRLRMGTRQPSLANTCFSPGGEAETNQIKMGSVQVVEEDLRGWTWYVAVGLLINLSLYFLHQWLLFSLYVNTGKVGAFFME